MPSHWQLAAPEWSLVDVLLAAPVEVARPQVSPRLEEQARPHMLDTADGVGRLPATPEANREITEMCLDGRFTLAKAVEVEVP